MDIIISFSLNSDAFFEDLHGQIAYVLNQVTDNYDTPREELTDYALRDSNGNTVGRVEFL